jgi:hypothetical protein
MVVPRLMLVCGDRCLLEHLLLWLEVNNLTGKSAEMGAIIRLYHGILVVRVLKPQNRSPVADVEYSAGR